ncbi:hypothetical protein SAMN04487954_1422 [Billgrantia gudaonensis]|uniref:Uncharacterized protein n=1 Tax=Billgrantia gudaonensis TaxID=376427 RepID=A0A1G9EYM4_9GAMM|nr:hypothetical protein SAMN04487954_1422 [Halomonas gudaonensis]
MSIEARYHEQVRLLVTLLPFYYQGRIGYQPLCLVLSLLVQKSIIKVF